MAMVVAAVGYILKQRHTNPDYLRWQAKTHLAQGVKGLDFWMLPFFDGRHHALLSELGSGARFLYQLEVPGPKSAILT